MPRPRAKSGLRRKARQDRHEDVMNAAEWYGPKFALDAVIDWTQATAPEFDPVVAELRRLGPLSQKAYRGALRS